MFQARSMSMSVRFHWRAKKVSFGAHRPFASAAAQPDAQSACARYAACAYSTSDRAASVRAISSASSLTSMAITSKFAYDGCVEAFAFAADMTDAREAADAPSLNLT